jgi:hypothetical protein
MTNQLPMQLREVNPSKREIVGRVAPYDRTSYLTQHPGGERLIRGCFARSLHHRETRIPCVSSTTTRRQSG